jgi:hypothetical protein
MANGAAGKLRPLFLVSRDFGELTRAIYFALEPEFDSCVLLRPSLHAIHGDDLPVPVQVYESVADVLVAVERLRPDVVFLFSGYLFAHDTIFSYDDLEQFIQVLHGCGCPVLTSDPFFGWLREVTASMEGQPERDWGDGPRPPLESLTPEELEQEQKQYFMRDFGRADAILQFIPHVYDLNPPPGFVGASSVIYSNQAMVMPPGPVPGFAEVQRALGLDPARPRWVFVLSGEEYHWLSEGSRPAAVDARVHRNRLHELLADQMYEALDQGRQPVLLAPQECTVQIALRSTPADGIVLLPVCRHSWFVSLVLEAEYAFYWNMFSNSLKLRIVNRLPYFLADLGHIGRSCPLLFERTARCYYVAGVPPYLDFSQPLDARALAREAAAQEPRLRAMADNLLQSPRPAEAVRQFLRRAGRGVVAPQGPVIGRGPAV